MAVVSDVDREQVTTARLAALENDGGMQENFGADSDEEFQLEDSDQGVVQACLSGRHPADLQKLFCTQQARPTSKCCSIHAAAEHSLNRKETCPGPQHCHCQYSSMDSLVIVSCHGQSVAFWLWANRLLSMY